MADEPRRSVRATKGQHTKMDLLDQTPEPKKKASKKSKKAAKEEEEAETEVIRCVCGAVESPDGDEEPWIACDNCSVWQHNVCVGITTFTEDIPDTYLCEQCNPEGHQELLDGLKQGILVWEVRRKQYFLEQARQEKEELKKKGKKKGKRTSDPKAETNGKDSAPGTPLTDGKNKKDVVARAGSAKRKVRDESQDKESLKEPKAKVRKVSAAHATPRQESPPSDLPVKITALSDEVKKAVAKLLLKNLKVTIPVAIKSGIYTLAQNDSADAKAERLAIQIQDAVWSTNSEDNFNNQSRTIAANLKHNQELTSNLLSRKLTPTELAMMSSDDMASQELKKKVGQIKASNDKQAIMVTDDGPRVRRTHKGEEVIESDNFAMTSDTTMSTSRRRSMLDPNAQMAARSRENSPGNGVELAQDIDSYRSHDDIRGNAAPRLAIQTKPPPVRKASTQQDFDINKVFSSVQAQSPTTTQHVRRESSNNLPPANGPGVDPEIDKMLQDDEGDSDAYSPAEYSSDPDIIWRGSVIMDSVARFPAAAKHVAGRDYESPLWATYLQKDLKVAGRIDQEKANEYLCGLRYSSPTDVAVVNIIPAGETAHREFQELYNYFETRKRYGVLTNKGVGNIRDTYLVPVPPNPGSLPDFITNLEGHKVPEIRSEPMILITLVIRNEWQPSDQHRGSFASDVTQSPSILGHPQRQMSISGTGPSMSPINPQGSFSTPPMPQQSFQPQLQMSAEDIARRQQADLQRQQEQRDGEAVAVDILGPYKDAPTVAFLMPQAFQMRPVEWQVIRGILEEDEKARVDLQHLSQVLEVRMQSQQPPPPNQHQQ